MNEQSLNPILRANIADTLGEMKSQKGAIALMDFHQASSSTLSMKIAAATALIKILDSESENKKFYIDYLVTAKKRRECNSFCKGKIDAALRDAVGRDSAEIEGIALVPVPAAAIASSGTDPSIPLGEKSPENVEIEEKPLPEWGKGGEAVSERDADEKEMMPLPKPEPLVVPSRPPSAFTTVDEKNIGPHFKNGHIVKNKSQEKERVPSDNSENFRSDDPYAPDVYSLQADENLKFTVKKCGFNSNTNSLGTQKKLVYKCPGTAKELKFQVQRNKTEKNWGFFKYQIDGIEGIISLKETMAIYVDPKDDHGPISIRHFEDKKDFYKEEFNKRVVPNDPIPEKASLYLLKKTGKNTVERFPCNPLDASVEVDVEFKQDEPEIKRKQRYQCDNNAKDYTLYEEIKYENEKIEPTGEWYWGSKDRPAKSNSNMATGDMGDFPFDTDVGLLDELMSLNPKTDIFPKPPMAQTVFKLNNDQIKIRDCSKPSLLQNERAANANEKVQILQGNCNSASGRIFDYRLSRIGTITQNGTTTLFSITDWQGQHALRGQEFSTAIYFRGNDNIYAIYDQPDEKSGSTTYKSTELLEEDVKTRHIREYERQHVRPTILTFETGPGVVLSGLNRHTRGKTLQDIGTNRPPEANVHDANALKYAEPVQTDNSAGGGVMGRVLLALHPLGFGETGLHSKAFSLIGNLDLGGFDGNHLFFVQSALGVGVSAKGILGKNSPVDLRARFFILQSEYDTLRAKWTKNSGLPQWSVGISIMEKVSIDFSCSSVTSGMSPNTLDTNLCYSTITYLRDFYRSTPEPKIN
ncbi:MAG: hypothetical protein Q8P84_01610 [Deltaproteobacteria bacterium]|nr:hypothetical protein [Deltaproteobacteria bacterium]